MSELREYTNQMLNAGYIIHLLQINIRNQDFIVQINLHENYLINKKVFSKLLFEKIGTTESLEVLIDDSVMYHLNGEYVSYQTLKNFFGSYDNSLGQINQSIVKEINNNIPNMFIPPTADEVVELRRRINNNDDFWNKIYLSHVRRLKDAKRSTRMDEKASLLRPEIYAYFLNDRKITFHWSEDPNLEKTDDEIKLLYISNYSN